MPIFLFECLGIRNTNLILRQNAKSLLDGENDKLHLYRARTRRKAASSSSTRFRVPTATICFCGLNYPAANPLHQHWQAGSTSPSSLLACLPSLRLNRVSHPSGNPSIHRGSASDHVLRSTQRHGLQARGGAAPAP